MPNDVVSSVVSLDSASAGAGRTESAADAAANVATAATAANVDEADRSGRGGALRRAGDKFLAALCLVRRWLGQFISLYLLSVFVIVIGVFLVEIQQRTELEKQFQSGESAYRIRISNIIHYGASEDSLANIVDDATPQYRPSADSQFNEDHYFLSDTLSNMSSRTLLLLAVLLAGWSGSLVGTVYRKENFEFRTSVIGLGASFLVWLGSHSTIQLVSLGTGTGAGDPNSFDITLMAFLSGFAAQKVMLSLESLPIRGMPGKGDGSLPAPPAPPAPVPPGASASGASVAAAGDGKKPTPVTPS